MNNKIFTTLAIIFVFSLVIGCTSSASSKAVAVAENVPAADASPKMAADAAGDEIFDGKEIVKSNEEWKKILTAEQYHTLREAGTDSPDDDFGYTSNHEEGFYYCAACHLKVFSSKHKFESGTGWPSFYQPVNKKNVLELTDKTLGMVRTEVLCARCRGHLGHVFDDGPVPTGLRYCLNSTALKFEKAK